MEAIEREHELHAARHRIKLFLEKSENWLFLDPAKAPEAFEKFEQARTAFVMGMTEPDPVRSELLHRDALALGIFASEQLVMKRTEWQLHRRFGAKVPDYAAAEHYYDEALRLDPKHKGALEYSGELYLMLDRLPQAEARLAALDKLCLLPCAEYTELKNAVAAYKANGNRYAAKQ